MNPQQQLARNKRRLGMMVFALICKQYRGYETKKSLLARMKFIREQIRIGETLTAKQNHNEPTNT